MQIKYILLIIILSSLSLSQSDSTGAVKGRIVDTDSQLPLVGANIALKSTDIGSVSDEEGYFNINQIPMGYYTVTISYMGYKTQNKADIWVRPKATSF